MKPENQTWPIAELFYSLQGEGTWSGTPMLFVRLAGCNVGKYYDGLTGVGTNAHLHEHDGHLFLQRRHSVCTTCSGEKFLCDTDYHKTEMYTTAQLLEEACVCEHVCITGGEPFMHEIAYLVHELQQVGKYVHIETSGTKPWLLGAMTDQRRLWITCCPKEGFLLENSYPHEWKFLVAPGEDARQLVQKFFHERGISQDVPVFLQPINRVHETDYAATKWVVDQVLKYPEFRMSAQLHKYWSVR